MKLSKTLIRIGLVLLIVVAVVLAVRAVFNYTEGRKLTRTLAELKKQGIPLSAKDLAPPCPDEDNAARLWKAAENLLTIEGEDRGILSKARTASAEGKPVEPAYRAALEQMIAKNEKVLELIRAMAGKSCFLYRDRTSLLTEAKLPDAIKMIQATSLLGFDALFRAQGGDVPGAIDRIRLGLKFTPQVAQEGFLMTHLIAGADTRNLGNFLSGICNGQKIGDDTVVQLIGELDPAPWRERVAGAIRGERVFFIEVGDLAMRSSLKDLDFIFGEPFFLKNIGTWIIRPVLKRDVRKALPIFQALEAQAKHPYFESRAFLRGQEGGHRKRPWYAFLSKAMIGNFEAAFMKGAMLEASLLAARTGLACRLFKSRTGAYPERLEALVPGILKEVPIDPFTGKPFVYRREGEGFIVYSLGSNEKDDGGRSTYNITQMVMEKDDDWTWKEDK
jgi:hypothetical protein